MKIFFPENSDPVIADYANLDDEPKCLSFTLKETQSRLEVRYEVVDGKLADKYPDLDDEAVCKLLQDESEAEALRIEQELSAQT